MIASLYFLVGPGMPFHRRIQSRAAARRWRDHTGAPADRPYVCSTRSISGVVEWLSIGPIDSVGKTTWLAVFPSFAGAIEHAGRMARSAAMDKLRADYGLCTEGDGGW